MNTDSTELHEKYLNPIRVLSKELGETEYPLKNKDLILKLFFILFPCGILITLGYIFQPLNTLFMTFAGAFASIQLVEPYQKYASNWRQFFINNREETGENLLPYVRNKIRFMRQPSIIAFNTQIKRDGQSITIKNQSRYIGYSPFELKVARLRFRRIAKKWDKHFFEISRCINPDTEPDPPVQMRISYYRAKSIDFTRFIQKGKNKCSVIIRLIAILPFVVLNYLYVKFKNSEYYTNRRIKAAGKILCKVGNEIYNVNERSDAKESVIWLSEKLGLNIG